MPEPKRCSCCEKHTLRAEEEKKKLLNRLRRIEGQVRGIRGMVEKGIYCPDILVQSAAVTAAMSMFSVAPTEGNSRYTWVPRRPFGVVAARTP